MPIVIGGIEASLRRIAHYDYWSGEGAPLGPARRQGRPARVRQRRAADRRDRASARGGRADRRDHRRARHRVRAAARRREGWIEIDSTHVDAPGRIEPPHRSVRDGAASAQIARRPARRRGWRAAEPASTSCASAPRADGATRERSVIRLPSLRAGARRPGAVRARLAHPAPRDQSRQRARAGAAPRRPRRVAQSAADPAHDAGDGRVYELPYRARAASGATATRRSPPTR